MKKPIHQHNLPGSIKVGYRDITITRNTMDQLVDAYGDYQVDKQLIRIGDWLKPQAAAETLLHELLHACWPQGLNLFGNIEESFVTGLAPMLAQVWRDNPDLVDWISYNLLGE